MYLFFLYNRHLYFEFFPHKPVLVAMFIGMCSVGHSSIGGGGDMLVCVATGSVNVCLVNVSIDSQWVPAAVFGL